MKIIQNAISAIKVLIGKSISTSDKGQLIFKDWIVTKIAKPRKVGHQLIYDISISSKSGGNRIIQIRSERELSDSYLKLMAFKSIQKINS